MEIIKASTAAEFLGMVPNLVGHDPANSMVFIPFAGKQTIPAACRVDLPRRDRRSDLRAVVHNAVSLLSRIPHADGVGVVIYTDRSFAGERGTPHLELGRVAVDALRRAGFHVALAACVADDGWGDYLDHSHQAEGRPLAEIPATPVVDVPDDTADLLSRDVLEAPAEARSYVAQLLGYEQAQPTENLVPIEWEARTTDFFELILEAYEEPFVTAVGLGFFEMPGNRDAALLHYAFGYEVGEEAVAERDRLSKLSRNTGKPLDELILEEVEAGQLAELGGLFLGRTDRIPDRARLITAIGMLRALVAHAPDELRPTPLSMLGWCLWALGATSAAVEMLDHALRISPKYRLAVALRAWMDAGALPDWLFTRLDEVQ